MAHTSHLKSDRQHERLPLVAEVSVHLQSAPVVGSGRNISAVGVYFITEGNIRATVRIGEREVEGTLVRVEAHGEDRTGIAVKFDEGAFDGSRDGSDGGPAGGSDGGPAGGSDGGPAGGSDGGPAGGSDGGPDGGSDGDPEEGPE